MKSSVTQLRIAFILLLGIIVFALAIGSVDIPISDPDSPYTVLSTPAKPSQIRDKKVGPVHMLVVFTVFADESPESTTLPYWSTNLFNGEPGSVDHYFAENFSGQMPVTGTVFPKLIRLSKAATEYTGKVTEYALEVIMALDNDPDMDFSHFDNDGPDGNPGSNDDDTYVDYLILMPRTRPYDFISNAADGVASLRLSRTYISQDCNNAGEYIKLDSQSGSISTAPNFSRAVGMIAHEFLHEFYIPDLYDGLYEENDDDSGGVGSWCIMGRGTRGYNDIGIPSPPSPYVRLKINCIGDHNSQLEDIYGENRNIFITDLCRGGKVYRIWINDNEYFLVEYRSISGSYYNSINPASGILIWHIDTSGSNSDEQRKLCDLECPDGRYLDAGYPIGRSESTHLGGDNLDFWSHSSEWNLLYGGNLGDSTDVYDGIRFSSFTPHTNPNTDSNENGNEITNVEIFNIRPDGDGMRFDLIAVPFILDELQDRYPLLGSAYQRFNSEVLNRIFAVAKQSGDTYLVGAEGKPESYVIAINKTTCALQSTEGLSSADIQRIVVSGLLGETNSSGGIRVIREPVSWDGVAEDIRQRNVTIPDDIGDGAIWAQKITLLTSPDKPEPFGISVGKNYPNPFNARTMIPFSLTESREVIIDVYSLLGQRLDSIDRGYLAPGKYTAVFDGGHLPSGIYFYHVRGMAWTNTQKFTLIR